MVKDSRHPLSICEILSAEDLVKVATKIERKASYSDIVDTNLLRDDSNINILLHEYTLVLNMIFINAW